MINELGDPDNSLSDMFSGTSIFQEEFAFLREANSLDEHSTGIPDMLSDLVEDPNDHTNSEFLSDRNTASSINSLD